MKIQSVKLIDERVLEFGDFNVIIGGNAVGKTTLMLELFSRADERERPRWYWLHADPLAYSSENPHEDLKLLQGSMSKHYEGGNIFYHSQSVRNLEGNSDRDGRYRLNSTEYDQLGSVIRGVEPEPANALLNQFRYFRPFIAFASCEARLNLPNNAQVESLDQSPNDPLNVLFRNRALRRQIDQKIHSQFGLHLALLDHKRSQLDLGLSRETPPNFNNEVDDLQEEYSKIEDWKTSHFSSIHDVGHGIRSMVRLLMSLLDPVNQIVLIDEPELFIYPAQKRWLGKQLVNLAQKQSKQVFLVTHDPIILQGILDLPGTTQVLRIECDDNGQRTLRQCNFNPLDMGAKRNQESYLQGLFYQRSIAVEGAADRAFYQIMAEELMGKRIENKDVGFVACGGIGGSKNVAYIASQVGLRTAIIYDFDVLLFNIPVLRDVVDMREGKHEKLDALSQFILDQFGTDEKRIKKGTKRANKVGFNSEFVLENKSLFQEAIKELNTVGIFIVPGGSLESWAPDVEPIVRFAEIAPDIINERDDLQKPLLQFFDGVLNYTGCKD